MPPAVPVRPTLLVVEDNEVSREGLALVLSHAGFRVVPAANGEEALHLLWGGPPVDLVLLDMLMPVLDGWHFLDRLKRQPRRPPVIVTTSVPVLSWEWAGDHGCAGFLHKPVEAEDLLAEVARCLGSAGEASRPCHNWPLPSQP
jgi:CheY-like chemotaxis protein